MDRCTILVQRTLPNFKCILADSAELETSTVDHAHPKAFDWISRMSESSTALVEPAEEAVSSSRLLGSSLGSLTSLKKDKSQISKAYKQATELFLTRRLSEALSTIEPLVTVPQPSDEIIEDQDTPRLAPIARASRNSRIKVWVFYLTLLNAIAELGPEDGKAAFGNKVWRDLVSKAQDGSIWNEVVDIGYGGVEGKVDADVVISLATLILALSTSQESNQKHLESYLSASNDPKLDLGDRVDALQSSKGFTDGRTRGSNGTDTPRDLNAHVNIIELYTLHVLPRNGDWQYAKDFINMSEVLDEDIRDSLLLDLHSLENEKEESRSDKELEDPSPKREQLSEQEPQPSEDTEMESVDTVLQAQPPSQHRTNSEKDYGIDSARAAENVSKAILPPQPTAKPAKSSHAPPIKAPRKPANTGVYKRSIAMVSTMQNIIAKMAEQISRNPLGILRFVLFLVGLVLALSRRDVKDRLSKLTGSGWDKIKRTVGMGVKVSYI